MDLDKKVIQVREALEQTKQHGIRFKAPKSKAGRRDVTLPDILVDALREHRKAQLELRMRLRLPDDALLFADIEGVPASILSPSASALGTPSRTSRCASTLTCSAKTMERLRLRSTQFWVLRVPISLFVLLGV